MHIPALTVSMTRRTLECLGGYQSIFFALVHVLSDFTLSPPLLPEHAFLPVWIPPLSATVFQGSHSHSPPWTSRMLANVQSKPSGRHQRWMFPPVAHSIGNPAFRERLFRDEVETGCVVSSRCRRWVLVLADTAVCGTQKRQLVTLLGDDVEYFS